MTLVSVQFTGLEQEKKYLLAGCVIAVLLNTGTQAASLLLTNRSCMSLHWHYNILAVSVVCS